MALRDMAFLIRLELKSWSWSMKVNVGRSTNGTGDPECGADDHAPQKPRSRQISFESTNEDLIK